MISEVVVGAARVTPVARPGWLSFGVRPDHGGRRVWLERGLYGPKLVCPPAGPQSRPAIGGSVPTSAPVVIAVDPHKASWTAVVVDRAHRPLASIRVDADRDGYRRLRVFLGRGPRRPGLSRGPAAWGPAHRTVERRRCRGSRRARQAGPPGSDAVHGARPQGRRGRRPVRRCRRGQRQVDRRADRRGDRRAACADRAPRRPGAHAHPDRKSAARPARPARPRGRAPPAHRRHRGRSAAPGPASRSPRPHSAPGRRRTAHRTTSPRPAHRLR